MFTNNKKGTYPFILAILSVMDGNLDFQRIVAADSLCYDVFENGNMAPVNEVVRRMYTSSYGGNPTLAELIGPMMFNPAFILQIIAQTGGDKRMGSYGKGDIWQWAGVNRHEKFNGQVRPVVEVNLADLRKAVRPTISW